MARFIVTLTDHSDQVVDRADAYQLEGPLTTFFAFAEGRETVDSWSSRLASFRTADLLAVRRLAPADDARIDLTDGADARCDRGGRVDERGGARHLRFA